MQFVKSPRVIFISVAIAYLFLVLLIPAAAVFYEAFHKGIQPFINALSAREFIHAVQLSLIITVISLVLNTIFGLCAAWVIARNQFRGRALLMSIIDLPFSVSPVVAGLMIVLLYGRLGWFGSWLETMGIKVILLYLEW